MASEEESKIDKSALDVPKGWGIRRLDEVASVIDPWPSHRAPKIFKNGYPYVGIGDISENGEIEFEKTRKVGESVVLEQESNMLFDDRYIGLGKVGTVGKVVWVKSKPFRYALSATMVLIKPTSKINKNFLYYIFKSPNFQGQISRFMTGTTRPTIGILTLRTLEIPVPSLEEQLSISKILSDLDAKIELNQKMNKTLEAIAQAIFKHWFIDFEFPNEEGKPYKSSGGEMVDSELGEIPKGWKLANFTEEFVVNMGQSPPGKSYNIEGRGEPFFQGRKDFGERFPSIRVYCNDPKKFASKGETLISVRAPVGDLNKALVDCCIGRGLASIKHASGSLSYTYYTMVSMKSGLKDFESKGTVFGSISKSDFGELNVIAPRTSIIQEFEKIIGAFDEVIELNTIQNRTLEAARDSLLPKLMSGRLRVPLED